MTGRPAETNGSHHKLAARGRWIANNLNNESPEQLARRGLKIQIEEGLSVIDTARRLGVSWQAYAYLTKMVLLVDDKNLREADLLRVRQVLDDVNDGGFMKEGYERISDIARAKFGNTPKKGYERGAHLQIRNLRRIVAAISAPCAALDQVQVPTGIPTDARKDLSSDLESALKSLRRFIQRIKEA